jgi:hypothetical protein
MAGEAKSAQGNASLPGVLSIKGRVLVCIWVCALRDGVG